MKSESLTEKLRIYAYCRYLNDKNEPQLQRDFLFYQGNIYCCPRAGHGSDLGVIRLSDREVAHIRTSESAAKRQKEIEKLKGIRYSEACYYCLSGTDRFKRIDYE